MLKLLLLSTVQSLCLVSSQVFLKLAVARMGQFSFTINYIKQILGNWQLAISGISIVSATVLWMYILKYYDFSIAYPMISISYIFGMLAAVFIFNETIPLIRWIGVFVIIIGVVLIAKQ